MDCGTTEYLAGFRRKVWDKRVPLSGTFELTRRCNLRCAHCYLEGTRHSKSHRDELPTLKILDLLDRIAEAGCLFLILTGGEPLMRKDFARIYTHSKQRGLLPSVFTNGTLLDEDLVALFTDLPPRAVEITLYGATAAAWERMTGSPDAFSRTMRGIDLLLCAGIRVKLKTVLTNLNRHELPAMKEIADSLGAPFRMDPALFPRFNGDQAPVDLRVPAEEAVAVEMSDRRRVEQWREFARSMDGVEASDRLYTCGAGMNMFHIDAAGYLQPCLMTRDVRCDLSRTEFRDGWDRLADDLREKKIGLDTPCVTCKKRAFCGFCPGFFDLETGDSTRHSPYLCAIGHTRAEKICETTNGEQQ